MSDSNKVAEIFQGEDFDLGLFLKNEDGGPFDLTGATEITARFALANGSSLLEKKLTDNDITVDSYEGGEITVALSDTDTPTMKVADKQSFDVVINKSGDIRICFFRNNLSVKRAMA